MCEIKRINGYACPKCKKIYKRKGKYLQAHLKACKQPAWIPTTIIEIKMRKIKEDKLAMAIEGLINGKFGSYEGDPIERIKQEAKESDGKKKMICPCFNEYKEKINNGGFNLEKVPSADLRHFYNIIHVMPLPAPEQYI